MWSPARSAACLPCKRLRAGVLLQVARSRKYTPSQDDVGFVLKYECSIFDPNHPYIDLGRPMLAFTSRVRPAPNLPVRNLVALPLAYNVTKAGPSSRFTVLSYNMLADLYAKVGGATCVLCSDSTCCRQQQQCCQRAVAFAVVASPEQPCKNDAGLQREPSNACIAKEIKKLYTAAACLLWASGDGFCATPQPGAHA